MNGSERDSEITTTDGRGDVNREIQVLQGNGNSESISHEGDTISGGSEVGQESSQENTQIQAPKSRRREVSQEEKEKTLKLMVEDSIKNGLAAYNGLEIKKLYPKTYDKIAKYMGEKSQIPGLMDEETVVGILLYSPRIVLFDFFDINEIYVNTEISVTKKWYYKLNSSEINVSSNAYENRLEAEIDGFMKAFEVFEYK